MCIIINSFEYEHSDGRLAEPLFSAASQCGSNVFAVWCFSRDGDDGYVYQTEWFVYKREYWAISELILGHSAHYGAIWLGDNI